MTASNLFLTINGRSKYGAIEEFGKRDDHLDFDGEHDPDEGPDEMFRFVKVMKP